MMLFTSPVSSESEGIIVLVQDAARLSAKEVLKTHWDGSFPVDAVQIAKGLGLSVKNAVFKDPETSGAIIAQNGDATIYLAQGDSFERQVFTCAHELGHYFERKTAGDDDFSFEETRHPRKYDLHEFYADEFAGNLLMPRERFEKILATTGSISALADYFGVSRSAVKKRLDRLRKLGAALTV